MSAHIEHAALDVAEAMVKTGGYLDESNRARDLDRIAERRRDRITVQEAAILAKRAPSRIYAWIREDRLCSWEADDGTLRLDAAEVLELEARMRRRKNNTTRPGTVAA